MGNQMIFRASFSIAQFFMVRTVLTRFVSTKTEAQTFQLLLIIELPVYIAMLVGSFFIPSSTYCYVKSLPK
uniref:Uncharacterized protein n=1 Tax=Globisporangium ultimum (strain ATCC 200006 / CBS 805.95 / DAOM BR144) TaxID=431595 RepID=K3WUJ1_GLOUD